MRASTTERKRPLSLLIISHFPSKAQGSVAVQRRTCRLHHKPAPIPSSAPCPHALACSLPRKQKNGSPADDGCSLSGKPSASRMCTKAPPLPPPPRHTPNPFPVHHLQTHSIGRTFGTGLWSCEPYGRRRKSPNTWRLAWLEQLLPPKLPNQMLSHCKVTTTPSPGLAHSPPPLPPARACYAYAG